MNHILEKCHVRPFQSTDQQAVRQLVLAGLGHRFGSIDETINSDLDDIAASYLNEGATFLVLVYANRIIACGALTIEDYQEKIGRIERVSVAESYQGKKLGSHITEQLITAAQQRHMTEILVETNEDWYDALHLYQKYQFKPYKHEHGEVHMRLALNPA